MVRAAQSVVGLRAGETAVVERTRFVDALIGQDRLIVVADPTPAADTPEAEAEQTPEPEAAPPRTPRRRRAS